jgi:hypothetical protein
MSGNNGSLHQGDSRLTEEFEDFAGRTRTFKVNQDNLPWGYGVKTPE